MNPLARRALAVLFALTFSASAQTTAPAIRAARSVHLAYTAPEATAFYNELTVEQSTAGSYFMACGFSHGYFGIQEKAKGQKVVIFSVWDPTAGNNPKDVPADQRVETVYKADDVRAARFGGEGTGGSFLDYDWTVGSTYRFCVRASSADGKTSFAGYFYLPESKSWRHLVTFRTATAGDHLKGLYSFVEDFRRDGKSASDVRRAIFGNAWARDLKGDWQPITKARFTASGATWEAKETIDAGVVRDRFYLQTGGDTRTHTALRSMMERAAGSAAKPEGPPEE